MDWTNFIEVSEGKILEEVYVFDSFVTFEKSIFNSVLTVQELDVLADIFNQEIATEMLSGWIDLDLEVISEPEVLFLVPFVVAFTFIHQSNRLLGIAELMKGRSEILDARVFLLTVLDGFCIKLQRLEEIALFGLGLFGLFVEIHGLGFFGRSFALVVIEESLEGNFEVFDDAVQRGSDFGVMGHIYKGKW